MSRSLLLSVLSLVMVVLMMLLMFFMSAKMWAMRCWRVWGAVPAECYSDHHQSSQRVICWIIQLMKLQKYYSIAISLCKRVCVAISPVANVVDAFVLVPHLRPCLYCHYSLSFSLPLLREILEEWLPCCSRCCCCFCCYSSCPCCYGCSSCSYCCSFCLSCGHTRASFAWGATRC